MTVSSTTNKISYNCNGSTSVFAYTFKILDENDVLVQIRTTSTGILTTLIKTTDYTVSGVNIATGGNITLLSPSTSAPTGTTIILTRDMIETQETDYTEYDTFPASSHETALDRLTMITQQIQEQLDRSFKLDSGVSGVSAQFVGTPTANQIPLVNSTATGFVFGNLSGIPAYNFPVGVGILVQSSASTAILRSIVGTAGEIMATNADGTAGNPTLSLPASLIFTGKTVTNGTFVTSSLQGVSYFSDNSDTTKRIHFDLSGITTATTRNVVFQDVSGTVYVSNGTDVSVADGGSGRSSATAYAVICGGTTATGASQSIVSVGTSGQFLGSNGPGALPSMQSLAVKFSNVIRQVFTSSGTYTPTTGMVACLVKAGGGGGGGGGASSIAAQLAVGVGGSAGDEVTSLLTAADIGVSKVVTIGALGAGGTAGNTGSVGGDTSLGSLVVAKGGNGGTSSGSKSAAFILQGVSGNGASTGTTVKPGEGSPHAVIISAALGFASNGGNSSYGGGGRGHSFALNGSTATGSCAGGGGGLTSGASNLAGYNGSAGYIEILEFIGS